MTYEGKISLTSPHIETVHLGSLTWPGCFESVTWIVFNRYQQILNTYLETLFRHTLRFMNNRRTIVSSSSAHRNVRTNIGSTQWVRSPSTDCQPLNHLLEYQSKINGSSSSLRCIRSSFLVNRDFDLRHPWFSLSLSLSFSFSNKSLDVSTDKVHKVVWSEPNWSQIQQSRLYFCRSRSLSSFSLNVQN